jgi:hypothetical protein
MDVPLKFALPLLLLAALPAGFAVRQNLPAASARVTPAADASAPDPLGHQDEAEVARQADEAIAIGRARQAAAQAERDPADVRVVLMPDQKMIVKTYDSIGAGTTDAKYWKEEEEQRIHDDVVRERLKLESTRAANCARSRWHCERP